MKAKGISGSPASSLWLFFLIFLVSPSLGADIGSDWLAAQRDTEGAYASSGDVSTAYQSTAEVLETAAALGVADKLDVPGALAFLSAQAYAGAEYLARRIIVLTAYGEDVSQLVQQLAGYQDYSGGFGDLAGGETTVLDTAFALVALAAAGEAGSGVAGYAIGYLTGQQNPDGGWSHAGQNGSSVYLTALSLQALARYQDRYDLETAMAAGRDFLLAARDSGQIGPEGCCRGPL